MGKTVFLPIQTSSMVKSDQFISFQYINRIILEEHKGIKGLYHMLALDQQSLKKD